MCGIFGFIGSSTNPKATYDLVNALLINTEQRGEHATGFWACEHNGKKLFFDKEAVKSSIYATRPIWKDAFSAINSDLFLGHCRLSTINSGSERFNKNNHPHVSADKRVALVHNGKVTDYSTLKVRYNLRSDCDSEILLGMFESNEQYKNKKEDELKDAFPSLPTYLARRMMGISEIFQFVTFGAMAVAIAERDDGGGRRLWLFRDDERPLHVVDARETLGQIFFCSTVDIWRESVEKSKISKEIISGDQELMEFPAHQVWVFEFDETKDDPWFIKKFRINKTKFFDMKIEEYTVKMPRIEKEDKLPFDVVTRLDSDEDLHEPKRTSGTLVPINEGKSSSSTTGSCSNKTFYSANDNSGIDMEKFEERMKEVKSKLESLEAYVTNGGKSLSQSDFDTVMDALKDVSCEIEGTLLFLK